MTVCIKKSTAVGTVAAPPSKSMAHRMLICAGLAAGESKISGISGGEDIAATIDCLRALGVDITVCGDVATVHGINLENAAPTVPLCCRESGSTLRFWCRRRCSAAERCTLSGAKRCFPVRCRCMKRCARSGG